MERDGQALKGDNRPYRLCLLVRLGVFAKGCLVHLQRSLGRLQRRPVPLLSQPQALVLRCDRPSDINGAHNRGGRIATRTPCTPL